MKFKKTTYIHLLTINDKYSLSNSGKNYFADQTAVDKMKLIIHKFNRASRINSPLAQVIFHYVTRIERCSFVDRNINEYYYCKYFSVI